MIAINKHSSTLKDWSVEMPNAPNTIPLHGENKKVHQRKKTTLYIALYHLLKD